MTLATIKSAIPFLIATVVFAGFFFWNLASGVAILRPGSAPRRNSNPLGFWLIQSYWVLFCAGSAIAAGAIMLGSPP
jgi:hypothetical protein